MIIVFVSNGLFTAGMRGQALGDSTVFGYGENIEASHTVGCKGDLFSVGTPYRFCVESRIGSDLCGTSAGGRYGVDVSFVREGNSCTIRR